MFSDQTELTNQLLSIYLDAEHKNDLLLRYINFAKELTGFENGFISFIEDQYYEIIQSSTLNNKLVKGDVFSLCDTLCQEVVDKGELVFHCKLKGKPQYKLPGRAFLDTEAVIGIPLFIESKIWGTFTLCSTREQDEGIFKKYQNILSLTATMASRYLQDISLKEKIDLIDKDRANINELLEKRIHEQNSLLNAIPEWIFRIDSNGIIVDCKIGEFEPITPPEELIGESITKFFDPKLADKALKYVQKCLTSKDIIVFEYTRIHNNKIRYFKARVAGVSDNRVLAIVKETTEEKEAQNFLNETQKIARIGGWELNTKSGKVKWTDQIYDIYGIDKNIETDVEIGVSQYHKDDQNIITSALENSIEKQMPFDRKLRFIQANGNEIWVRAIGKPIVDEKGKTIAVKGTFQDVNKEERVKLKLNKERETFKFLIEHTPSAIAMFDTNMRYLARSKRWMVDYNLGEEDIIGRSHYKVFPDIPDRWKKNHQDVLSGEIYRNDEDKWERENGDVYYIRYELRPWYDDANKVGGLIMFTEVITEQVENRLRLEKTVEELLRSNVDLEQFAFVASHDLQQPLRMIGNFSELLQINYADKIDEECGRYLNIISDSATRMKELINNLLDYSRVGRKEKEYSAVVMEELINSKLKDLALVLEEKNVNIVTSLLSIPVHCEAQQIGLVFYNLISNAIKFNKSAIPQVQIIQKDNETHHLFQVIDNGIGLKKEYENKAFLIFQRLHTKSEYEGTGIGLALCKKIISRHDGTISYHENPEGGTTFEFSIKKI